MRAHWRDAVDRPLTDAELDDLFADATADMGSWDAIERFSVEIKSLRAAERLLSEYLRKIANRVGAPTSDPLVDHARIEQVGEGVLARIERLRAVEQAASTYVLADECAPEYACGAYDALRAALKGGA